MTLELCKDDNPLLRLDTPSPIPEWKQELVNRVRLAKTGRAGIYNVIGSVSPSSSPVKAYEYDGDEQRSPLTATNDRRSLDCGWLQPDFHFQQRTSASTSASFDKRCHRDTLLFHRCRRRRHSREIQEEVPASSLVDNMKLLNEVGYRDSAAVVKHCARITTSSLNSSPHLRENYVKHVIEMNEEKFYDKSPLSVRISTANHKYSTTSPSRLCAAKAVRSLSPPTITTGAMVSKQRRQRICSNAVDEDGTSDSSEELQYGPGIVNRLRTKYMSMTLRDNKKKFNRPLLSSMRKVNSLDNLLDDDLLESRVPGNGVNGNDKAVAYQISSVISCVNKLEYSNRESNVAGRVTVNFCTDLKRARSMEILQEENGDSNAVSSIKSVVVSQTKGSPVGSTTTTTTTTTIYDNCLNMLPLDSIVNEDIIIVENSVSTQHNGVKSEKCGNRAYCTLSEDKQARVYSPFGENKELPSPDVVKETLKIFENGQSPKKSPSPIKNWKSSKKKVAPKPTLYPKPTIVSVEPIRLPKKSAPSQPIATTAPICNAIPASFEIHENGSDSSSKDGISNSDLRPNHVSLSPPLSSTNINSEAKERWPISSKNCTAAINVNVIESTSQIVATVKKSPLKEIDVDGTPSPPPRLNCAAIENGDYKYHHDILKPSETSPVRQVGVIRPLVSSKISTANANNALTAQEIEKNYINARKNVDDEKINGEEDGTEAKNEQREIHQQASSKPKENDVDGANIRNTNKPSTLSVNKSWSQQQNTIVFNFKDRKGVPDYIENDGLLLTSNRERAKKILQEGGGTGYIILDVENGISDGANESSTDSPYISCKEEWKLICGPPSPCNVHFEGDNIVINGKSNLRKHPKEKKLRIQFNDTSTTFEYPSEASCLEDYQNVSTNGENGSTINSNTPDTVIVPCSTPKMTSPLGGSSLANYVPSKLSMGESFELGVTKSSDYCTNGGTNNTSTTKTTTTTISLCQQNEQRAKDEVDGGENSDYLKPATGNENVAWSEESIADLLF